MLDITAGVFVVRKDSFKPNEFIREIENHHI